MSCTKGIAVIVLAGSNIAWLQFCATAHAHIDALSLEPDGLLAKVRRNGQTA